MSGGHFQYRDTSLDLLADVLEEDIQNESREFSDSDKQILKTTAEHLRSMRETFIVLDRALSGDRAQEEGIKALKIFFYKNPLTKKLIDANLATILFYGAWTVENQLLWAQLTNNAPATTRGLCDFIRDTLAEVGVEKGELK